jgi:hypothetical protein
MSRRQVEHRHPTGRCGKVIFDELGAKIVFADMVRRDKEPERIYECDECDAGTWHITSMELEVYLSTRIPQDVAASNLLLIA